MSLQPVVSWTFAPDPDVAGYRIYYSTVSGNFSPARMIDIPVPCQNWYRMKAPQITYWVTNYVRMTAYDTSNNESVQSPQASVFVTGGLLLK